MNEPTKGAKVLFVDDEPFLMSYLVERLRDECHEVALATTLTEAARRLSENQYDLVLLDIMLPLGPDPSYEGSDSRSAGSRLLKELRQGHFAGTGKDVPVIVMTARADPVLRRQMSKYGVSSFLEKPVLTSDIIKAIKEAE